MIIGIGYVLVRIFIYVLWIMILINWKCVYGDYWFGVYCINNIIEVIYCINDVIGVIVLIL